MAYQPPTTSKWSSANTDSSKSEDGWQTVGRSSHGMTVTSSNATKSKWGQSALKKPEPKYEDLFPSLSGSGSGSGVVGGGTKASMTTKSVELSTEAKPLSMAERMKLRLADEEAERLDYRTAEEERMQAKAKEQDARFIENIIPLRSFISGRIANDFKVEQDHNDHEYDASYYNEYPEHYDQDHGLQPPYDDTEDAEDAEYTTGGYDNDDHWY